MQTEVYSHLNQNKVIFVVSIETWSIPVQLRLLKREQITGLPALLMSHNILIGHPGLTGDWSGDQAMKIHSYP